MTDKEQLEILHQGASSWNQWRHDNPHIRVDLHDAEIVSADLEGIDFSEASLIGAKLIGANLTRSNLYHADLFGTDLRNADLSEANLEWAHLNNANLTNANFTAANLLDVEFVESKLSGANFSRARLGGTKFGNTDLSAASGLEAVIHAGPSNIGIDTIYRSAGRIPEEFLRGAGVPDNLITQIPRLVGAVQPIQFYSCFISYSTKDEAFARQLYSRMRAEHMRVWFAPEDIKGGQKLYEQIKSAIQIHDRLLLVLSENSMRSEWVITEIRDARRIEIEEKRRKLFPIMLVEFEEIRGWSCVDSDTGKDLAVEVREYFVPDFSTWEDHALFEEAFQRLLRDLKAEEAA